MEENYEDPIGAKSRDIGPLLFLGVLFFPSVIIGLLGFNYVLLRKLRLRFSVIALIAVAVLAVNYVVFSLYGGFNALLDFILNITDLSNRWQELFVPVLCFYVFVGVIVGIVTVGWSIREMRVNPWRLTHDTNWMYQFSYRRTPLQYLRFKKRIKELKNGEYTAKDFAPLGLNDEGSDDVAGRFEAEAVKHTLITGAPGSGKTISMLSLMYSDIKSNVTCFVIDFKRDPELASKLATWAKENNRPFYHFVNGSPESYDITNSAGQSCYDAIATGTPTSNADLLLSMREYDTSSAVYKAAMTQVLQILFNMIYVVKAKGAQNRVPADWGAGGFFTLASLLNPQSIGAMKDVCAGTDLEHESRALWEAVSQKSQEAHAVEELRGQLRTLTASEYGRWLRLREGFRHINLFELSLTPGAVVLYSLNSDSEKEFSSYMGSIIMGDLTNVSALRRNSGQISNPVHVYVDEFQVVNPTSVAGLLEKSRASNISVTLAQQSLEQIVSSSNVNGEAYLNSVLDTCGNFLIHNGSVESSALYYSNIIGKVEKQMYMVSRRNESFFGSLNFSNRRNHRVSASSVVDWEYEPKYFMALDSPTEQNGYRTTAVWLNKTSSDPKFRGSRGAKAQRLYMIPNDRVLEKYYSGAGGVTDSSKQPHSAVEPQPNSDIVSRVETAPTADYCLPDDILSGVPDSGGEPPKSDVYEVAWQAGKKASKSASAHVKADIPRSFAEMTRSASYLEAQNSMTHTVAHAVNDSGNVTQNEEALPDLEF